ncbi:MAG TPA: VOC family protein [Longimicrobiaceae bacterium]
MIHEVFCYLCVRDAAAALDFYARVFGAEESFRLTGPGGRIAHAELRLGPATVMLAGEFPEHGILSPLSLGGTGTTLHLHVDDVDELAARAAAAGATILRPPADQAHGERQCRLRDPFGHEWLLGHPIGGVSPGEMQLGLDADGETG